MCVPITWRVMGRRILLVTSWDAIQPKKRGFRCVSMKWRAMESNICQALPGNAALLVGTGGRKVGKGRSNQDMTAGACWCEYTQLARIAGGQCK